MEFLNRLEKKLRPFAIPDITLYVVVLQSLGYLMTLAYGEGIEKNLNRLELIPELVLNGEVWRLFTFVVMPPRTNPLFAFFILGFLYFIGRALESRWGTLRYNLYILVGWLAAVAVAFYEPSAVAGRAQFGGSLFLAFAFLYPEFRMTIYFVIPIAAKWLAWLTWAGYLGMMIHGPMRYRLMVLSSTLNFFLFFGNALYLKTRYILRHGVHKSVKAMSGEKPFHECTVCHVTDLTNRRMEFRYCPECTGNLCYCIDHINAHKHVSATRMGTGE